VGVRTFKIPSQSRQPKNISFTVIAPQESGSA
jgi:hypothetical protein